MDNNKRMSDLLGVPYRDWTTSDGKIELLRCLMKREDWPEFIKTVGNIKCHIPATNKRIKDRPLNEITVWGIAVVRVDLILDTTGLLVKAAIEWMEKEKDE